MRSIRRVKGSGSGPRRTYKSGRCKIWSLSTLSKKMQSRLRLWAHSSKLQTLRRQIRDLNRMGWVFTRRHGHNCRSFSLTLTTLDLRTMLRAWKMVVFQRIPGLCSKKSLQKRSDAPKSIPSSKRVWNFMRQIRYARVKVEKFSCSSSLLCLTQHAKRWKWTIESQKTTTNPSISKSQCWRPMLTQCKPYTTSPRESGNFQSNSKLPVTKTSEALRLNGWPSIALMLNSSFDSKGARIGTKRSKWAVLSAFSSL